MNTSEMKREIGKLPVKRIGVIDLRPDDAIVIECDQLLSQDAIARISEYVSGVFPGRKVLVLSAGMRISAARNV